MVSRDQSGSVTITPLRYTVGDLAAASEDEVVFFLMCAQLHNDVVILMRRMLQARTHESDPEPLRIAKSTARSLNVRLLVGRLSEGWPLIKDRFQKVFQEYGDAISEEAQCELKALTQYFSDANLMRSMRNAIAGHFDQGVAREAYRSLDPDEPLVDFHAEAEGNTIFFSGEALMLSSMHLLKGEETAAQSLDDTGNEVLSVASQLGNVVRAYIRAFYQRHLHHKLAGARAESILIEGQATLDEFVAPIFLSHPAGPRKPRPLPPRLPSPRAEKAGLPPS